MCVAAPLHVEVSVISVAGSDVGQERCRFLGFIVR